MHIAICDDEQIFVEKLQYELENEFKRYNEKCTFITTNNGEKLLDICTNEKIELVFLDIRGLFQRVKCNGLNELLIK